MKGVFVPPKERRNLSPQDLVGGGGAGAGGIVIGSPFVTVAPVLEKGGFNFREGDDTPYPWCAYRGTDRGEQSALALKASMVMPFEARTTQADSLF